jgi:putative ABC transport system permease protein
MRQHVVCRAGAIYGVLSYPVSQRAPEIGVRMALGARRGEIVRMIIASGARLGLIGIASGVARCRGSVDSKLVP